MSSSPSEKKSSDVEMGEANSELPTPAMHEATPTFIAGFLSFKERLSRRSAEKVGDRMKVVLRGVLRNSGFFEIRGRRSELSSHSLPPDDHRIHRSSNTGFRARPRFTFGLRLCDDKSAFVLPV
ncbi:hypothetical protein F2Q70_00029047 [Brassica cretica]|uniref:Uncharacterized protein n=1 Tax=Brassica cretica TaxID=69181 RepID=A0A8S9FNT7_BRACR|nr:hypothetical protein F2Q70_00029047 [Brassica cretica]